MSKSSEIGKLGEKLAIKFLTQKNYQIIARNFRIGNGEIDIISQQNNQIIFFEIKTFQQNNHKYQSHLEANEYISFQQQKSIQRTAITFLNRNPNLKFNILQFDLLTINLIKDQKATVAKIKHFQNIFAE